MHFARCTYGAMYDSAMIRPSTERSSLQGLCFLCKSIDFMSSRGDTSLPGLDVLRGLRSRRPANFYAIAGPAPARLHVADYSKMLERA